MGALSDSNTVIYGNQQELLSFPSIFMDQLRTNNLIYVINEPIKLSVQDEEITLINENCVSGHTHSYIVSLGYNHKFKDTPVLISQDRIIADFSNIKPRFKNGAALLKVTSIIRKPPEISSIILEDLLEDIKEEQLVNPNMAVLITNINEFSREVQMYVRLKQICVEDNQSTVQEDAYNLSAYLRQLVNVYDLQYSNLKTQLMQKESILINLDRSISNEKCLQDTLDREIRRELKETYYIVKEFLINEASRNQNYLILNKDCVSIQEKYL